MVSSQRKDARTTSGNNLRQRAQSAVQRFKPGTRANAVTADDEDIGTQPVESHEETTANSMQLVSMGSQNDRFVLPTLDNEGEITTHAIGFPRLLAPTTSEAMEGV